EKYPEAVHLSEGASSSCMGIRSPSRPGFELVIVWRIQIDEEGKVLPKLDLLTKVPLQVWPAENEGIVSVKFLTQLFAFFTALELDKNGVIETAPLSFRTLLGVLGIEATLESLIKSLHTEASN
ncbi:Centromere protein P, partial [Eschrichtius robustus]|nr:Centromere protein P [Eschrichtius robustus]